MAEDTLNIHILPTKLNPPKVDLRWVMRSRPILRLNKGLKKRLTLISAPAGYGKATLVVQRMDQVRRNSARLTLDKNDSDDAIPIDFALRHAVHGLRGCFVMNNFKNIREQHHF